MAKATTAGPEPDNNNCPMHEHYCMTCGTCNGEFDPITHERIKEMKPDNHLKALYGIAIVLSVLLCVASWVAVEYLKSLLV